MWRAMCLAWSAWLLASTLCWAEPPHASYIFPAGGQRGTKVNVRIGGHFLHDCANFEMLGVGATAPTEIYRIPTIWFEGPLIQQPASQQAEDYPQDYAAQIAIGPDAPLCRRWWRCWNAQGVTPALPFVVGDLPEIVEQELDGEPIPVSVSLPVTINGRIFPREDRDVWTFDAEAGQTLTCSVAARDLGSPLVAKLSAYSPTGKLLVESTGEAAAEARLKFVAPETGRYAIHISDVAAGGLQNYVYRLTVDRDEPEKDALSLVGDVLEAEPNETATAAKFVTVPVTIRGHIQQPGDLDDWLVRLTKGQSVTLQSTATGVVSPLAMVLTVRDESGQQIAQLDFSTLASGEGSLTVTAPADGTFRVEISERFARRGGPEFAYRVTIAPAVADFRLFAPDSVAIQVGSDKKLDLQIERLGTFKSPIKLHVEGLPAGVSCEDVLVQPNVNKATLTFKCTAGTPVISTLLKIGGRAEIDGQPLERTAVLFGQKDGFSRGEAVPIRLATTLATPFKFSGQFSFIYTARGSVLKKRYAINRGGFDGPLEARLADRQGRHLQGVNGRLITIPENATEFEYPVYLPPWMELGRTSRTNLMLTGELRDAAGRPHKVCYTTREQNEQLIALVTASPLRLSLDRNSLAIEPNSELTIPIAFKRDASVASPIKLELIVQPHMRDIAATPVEAPANADKASFKIQMGPNPGPLNMPLVLRATGIQHGEPVVAEESIELIRLP